MRAFKPFAQRVPLEKEIERDHRNHVIKFGWMVVKLMQTMPSKMPDRFYARCREEDRCPYCGRGRVVLMEWKREKGGQLDEGQEKRIEELRAAGVEVHVVKTLKEANRILGVK